MKNFRRKDQLFSLCGLNCGLCPMYLGNYCPGCGGGEGNQSCAVAACSLAHNKVEYCFLCSEFPCEKYQGVQDSDSFITHLHQLSDIKRAQDIGMQAYHQEQLEKKELLQTLLDHYNDGRKKTLYCTAVNLLPLEEIKRILKEVSHDESLRELSKNDMAKHVASLLENLSNQLDISLKLRKSKSKS